MRLSVVDIGDLIRVQYLGPDGLRSIYWIVTEIIASDTENFRGEIFVTLDIKGFNLWTKRLERIFCDHHNAEKPQLTLFRNGEMVLDGSEK